MESSFNQTGCGIRCLVISRSHSERRAVRMEGFLLATLLEERYRNTYGETVVKGKGLTNYKKDNREKVTDFLKALGLEEFLDDFKSSSYSGKGYWFYNEEKQFITDILDLSKENKYKLVRERNYHELEDEDAIYMFDFVYQMLHRRQFEGEELNRRLEGPYNLLDYPIRNITRGIRKSINEIYRIQEVMFNPRNRYTSSVNDNLEWVTYIQKDLENTVNKYLEIYGRMRANRRDEISEISFIQYMCMSDEEREAMDNEERLFGRSHRIYLDMPEVKKLINEEDSIMGTPKDLRERLKWNPKYDYTPAESKRLREILVKKNKYYAIAYEQAVKEIAAESDMSEEEVKKQRVTDFPSLKSPAELLSDTIKEIENTN